MYTFILKVLLQKYKYININILRVHMYFNKIKY
jgi:hypothetical protein